MLMANSTVYLLATLLVAQSAYNSLCDNKLWGESRTYYPSGQLEILCHYLDDKLYGYYLQFYDTAHDYLSGSDNLAGETVVNNSLDNLITADDKSRLSLQARYVGSLMHGEYKRWSQHGQLTTHHCYHYGKQIELSQ